MDIERLSAPASVGLQRVCTSARYFRLKSCGATASTSGLAGEPVDLSIDVGVAVGARDRRKRDFASMLSDWLAAQAARQADRWTLWTPVAFGLGAALYFALPREPQAWVGLLCVAAAAALLVVAARHGAGRGVTAAVVLLACAVGGLGAAKLRTESVKAPIAPAGGDPQRLEGWVVDVAAPGQGGQRLLIAPARIGDWPAAATPIRVRVTLRTGYIPAPGEPISLLAVINAPPPPASPGAYDFARDAFFESVGGVGFALGPPASWQTTETPPWRLAWTMRVNSVRWTLTQRIVDGLGPTSGGLAAAMTTGHEAFIPKSQVDDLRAAGLAHIISISGLHMAIVGGFAFAAARLGACPSNRLDEGGEG